MLQGNVVPLGYRQLSQVGKNLFQQLYTLLVFTPGTQDPRVEEPYLTKSIVLIIT